MKSVEGMEGRKREQHVTGEYLKLIKQCKPWVLRQRKMLLLLLLPPGVCCYCYCSGRVTVSIAAAAGAADVSDVPLVSPG
jgi:hypothetical protein